MRHGCKQKTRDRSSAEELIRSRWVEFKDLSFDKVKYIIENQVSLPKSQDEMARLNNWFKDEKRRLKNKVCPSTASTSEIVAKQEQADQILAKQEDWLLGRLSDMTEEKKREVLKNQLDENFLMILQFMSDQNNSPCDNFLSIMLDLCEDITIQHNQTLLFLKICASYQDEFLQVNENLMKQGFLALALQTLDQRAAYGLLKFAYRNNISFKSFTIDALVAFQDKYTQQIKGFYKTLKLPYQVVECLPSTCFALTSPFFALFKQGGAFLYQNIEPAYLTFFIEILAYSFENDSDVFLEFLQTFKEGCITIYLKRINLQPLLQRLTEEQMSRNQNFFGTLKKHITLFKHLFQMVNECKIDSLDEIIIEELVQLQEDSYLRRKQAPKNIRNFTDTDKTVASYTLQLNQLNKQEALLESFEGQALPNKDVAPLLKLFGINQLTPAQSVALNLVEFYLENQKFKLFQCLETGTGKTTLALVLLLNIVRTLGIQGCVIYSSDDLCLRDFNRLNNIARKLKVSAVLVKSQEEIDTIKTAQIFFMSAQLYYELAMDDLYLDLLSQQALIIDEFDQTIFQGDIQQKLSLLKASKYLFAFTGSPLEEVHQYLIREGLEASFVQHPSFGRFDGKENRCIRESIFASKEPWLRYIADTCKSQQFKTPILLVLDINAHKQFLKYFTKGILFRDLSSMNSEQVDSFLKVSFPIKEKERYFTCLISDNQGRGLDVPSNQEIEVQGGVAVIIAKTPQHKQELEQFKGRTKRMGNNGQHFITLFEKGFKESCRTFLDFTLETFKIAEEVKLNNILAMFRAARPGQLLNKATIKGQQAGKKSMIVMNSNNKNVQNACINNQEVDNNEKVLQNVSVLDGNNHEERNIEEKEKDKEKNNLKEFEKLNLQQQESFLQNQVDTIEVTPKKQEHSKEYLKEVKIDNEGLVVILPRANLKEFEQSQQQVIEVSLANIQEEFQKKQSETNQDQCAQQVEKNLDKKKALGKRNSDDKVKDKTANNKRQKLK